MSSCECCWTAAGYLAASRMESKADMYYVAMREHEQRGCPCADWDSAEGARLRAGMFWDADRGIDTRDPAAASTQGEASAG